MSLRIKLAEYTAGRSWEPSCDSELGGSSAKELKLSNGERETVALLEAWSKQFLKLHTPQIVH